MKRQLRQFSVFASVGLMVALGAAGVVRAGVATQPTSNATTTTVEQTVISKEVDVVTGTIVSSDHDFGHDTAHSLTGTNTVLEQFTALSDIVPLDLLTQIIHDPQVIGGTGIDQFTGLPVTYPVLNPALVEQLQSLQAYVTAHQSADAGNPSVPEYLLANGLGTELAYSLPPTQIVGTETVAEHDANGNVANVTQNHLVATGPGTDHVQDPSNVGSIGAPFNETTHTTNDAIADADLSAIVANTIGGRNALTAVTSSGSLGEDLTFTYEIDGPITSTTTTTNVGGIQLTTTNQTQQQLIGAVNVNFYSLTGDRFVSPIVLDISGGGRLEASNGNWLPHAGKFDQPKSRVFDFYNNGFPMAMEWVGPHDGLLVEPKTDGSVDGSCLFGTQGGWDNGYEKLSVRDTNHDNKLTGDELNGLAIWVDANQNTRCDSGELKTVQELGISEVNLNHHAFRSTFVMNGQTRRMWDWFPTAMEIKHISRDTAINQMRDQHVASRSN